MINEKLGALAKKYHSGMMDEYELHKLGELLIAVLQERIPGDYVIEIGTFHGLTACFLFEIMRSYKQY